MQIDDYVHVEDSDCQMYTSKEIGIPGIRLFGHLVNNKAKKSLIMHEHPNCIEICYIVKGNQIYRITDEKNYMLTGDNVFITFPNELHGSGEEPVGKFEIFWIQLEMSNRNNFLLLKKSFSSELWDALLNIKNHKFQCNNGLKLLLEDAFKNLTCENKIIKLSGLSSLIIFLSKIIEYDKYNLQNISPIIQKSKNFIEQNVFNKITLDTLANNVNLSLSHFKRRFKQETGETPNDYINYMRIQKAKEMLKSKKLSITEIAFALDFSSSSYFAQVFKHYTSMSPRDYVLLNIESSTI